MNIRTLRLILAAFALAAAVALGASSGKPLLAAAQAAAFVVGFLMGHRPRGGP